MTVEIPPAFHIFYATGWEDPVLRVRMLNADGTPQTPVSLIAMQHDLACLLLPGHSNDVWAGKKHQQPRHPLRVSHQK